MVLDYLKESGSKNNYLNHIVKVVELDESSPEVLELVHHYVRGEWVDLCQR